MSKLIHVSVDIDYLLGHTDAKLDRWLVGKCPDEFVTWRRYLYWLKSQGFENVPTCDDHDEKGRCRGHETEGPGEGAGR